MNKVIGNFLRYVIYSIVTVGLRDMKQFKEEYFLVSLSTYSVKYPIYYKVIQHTN